MGDQDIQVDDYGMERPVYDQIGQVVWTACPGRGEFWPPVGATTMFIAGFLEFDDSEEIMVEIWDSRQMGLDGPLHRVLNLSVKVPTANVPYWYGPDEKLGTDGPPDNSMGVGTTFAFQVQPNTVNFYGIRILETRAEQSWPWPNKTVSHYHVSAFVGSPANPSFQIVPGQPDVMHNILMDRVCTQEFAEGPWKKERLRNLDTGLDEEKTFPVTQGLYFQIGDDPPSYKLYQVSTHPRWFGTNFKSKVGWQGNGNAWTKDPRGPYTHPGQ